ncbi:hypothetical protein ABBQ32_14147 [Trebouxia sp. C0010 RCD-2024]
MVEDAPEMQLHLLSYVNKTEGALARMQASNIAGTVHPMAPKLSKVKDTWGNSVVRKRTIGLDGFPEAKMCALPYNFCVSASFAASLTST